MRQATTGEMRFDERKATGSSLARLATRRFGCKRGWLRSNFIARLPDETEDHARRTGNPGNVGLIWRNQRGGAVTLVNFEVFNRTWRVRVK
jgi:hypothetical protein